MKAAIPLALSLIEILSPAQVQATTLTGRADPFKPLIRAKNTFPVALPPMPSIEAPIERPVVPELVGIIADPDGALAALRLNQRVELLRQGERKGDVSVLSIHSDRVVISIQGRISELTIDRSTR